MLTALGWPLFHVCCITLPLISQRTPYLVSNRFFTERNGPVTRLFVPGLGACAAVWKFTVPDGASTDVTVRTSVVVGSAEGKLQFPLTHTTTLLSPPHCPAVEQVGSAKPQPVSVMLLVVGA